MNFFSRKVLECEHEIASSSCVWELACACCFCSCLAFRFAKKQLQASATRSHIAITWLDSSVQGRGATTTSFQSISLIIIARDSSCLQAFFCFFYGFSLLLCQSTIKKKRREKPSASCVTLTSARRCFCLVMALVYACVTRCSRLLRRFIHESRDQQDSHR